MPPLKYENLVDEEVKGDIRGNNQGQDDEEEGQGMISWFFGGVRSAISAAFGWCNDRDEEEVMDIERASAESLMRFKAIFLDKYRGLANNN